MRDADGRITGVETTRGPIRRQEGRRSRWPGNSSRVAAMAGLRLPIESHVLQAFVSEGLKPLIPGVITFGAGHFYISQSDKGGLVFGGDIDGYNSYAQRGNLPSIEDVCEGGMALMPMIGRAARAAPLGRHHGHVDGRLADHRPHADRRALSQCRLVLRRLQGDAGLGLVLRASDRHATSRIQPPPPIASIGSRPAISSTKRARAPSRTCIEARRCASPAPIAASATSQEFVYRGDAHVARPGRGRDAERALLRLCLSARQSGGRACANIGITRGLPQLARGDARHAHPRDHRGCRPWPRMSAVR